MSDLPRKSVEPMALAGGTAVRTLQEFLTHHVWDHARMRGKNPDITLEQVARALNTVCRRWLHRGCRLSQVELIAEIIQYHRARNRAAKNHASKNRHER